MSRFDRVRYWGTSLPLPAYFGFVTVLYGVLTWAFDAGGDQSHGALSNLVLHVVLGSFYGAVMTAFVAFQRRRFGGSTLIVATAKAIRAGAAPADADPAIWTPVLERRLQTLRRSRWLSPVLMAPIVIFAVTVWVLAPEAVVPALWLIALCLAVVAFAEIQVARHIPRTQAVLAQLRAGEFRPAAGAVGATSATGRPKAVLAALILCLAGAGAALGQLLIFLLAPAKVSSAVSQVQAEDHISSGQAGRLAAIAVTVITSYWCLLALALIVFGSLAFAGRNRGRGWLVPVALLALIELLSKQPLELTIPVVAVAAVVLLYIPASTAWFNGQRQASGARKKKPR